MLEIITEILEAPLPVTMLAIKGDVDSSNYKVFLERAQEALTNGARYLILNLKDVPFMSSAGLRVIHTTFNELRNLHKDVDDDELRRQMSAGTYKSPYLKLAAPSTQVREALELGGFETYIEVHDDVTGALNSF